MQGIESPGVGVFKYSTTSSMGAAFSLLHVHSSASSWGIPMPPVMRDVAPKSFISYQLVVLLIGVESGPRRGWT